jgi:hypothetical protein
MPIIKKKQPNNPMYSQKPKQNQEEDKQAKLVAQVGDDTCRICLDFLNNKEQLEQLENCKDIFHKECIDRQIITQLVENIKPNCPNCKTNISDKQISDARKQNKPLEKTLRLEAAAQAAARIAAEQAELAADYGNAEEEVAQVIMTSNQISLDEVIDNEDNSESAVPFFGVVLCNNQQMIIKYLNVNNFNLKTQNTLGELKAHILTKEPEILQLIPQGLMCSARNILSNFTSRVKPVTRRIQIGPMNFTTPSKCAIEGLITPLNYDDNTLLETIYLDYLNAAQTFLSSPEQRSENYNLVKDVYYLYHPPSDSTVLVTDFYPYQPDSYYRNLNNPTIPEGFRAEFSARERDRYGTKEPIAWLAFQIECINSGGKSRKSRKCKKSKKCKKSRKSRK